MEGRPDVVATGDGALVGQLAILLAVAGDAMLDAALDVIVNALGLRSAALRAGGPAGGDLMAVAGSFVHAATATLAPAGTHLRPAHQGDASPGPTSVSLPICASGQQFATLTVEGCRPAQQPVLRSCAAVLALALAAVRPEADNTTGEQLLAAQAADQNALADELHDGPLQTLAAARYAADAVVRGADPTVARDAVQAALVHLRRTLWQLRPRGGADLAGALAQLSDQLVQGGQPPLVLSVDPVAAATLPPVAATTAYRLVQASARTLRPGQLSVELRNDGGQVVLAVGGMISSLALWEPRLRVVGAGVTPTAQGLEVRFPRPLAAPVSILGALCVVPEPVVPR